jgi:hypothetical protein
MPEPTPYQQGIIDFVGKMSADYRKHNAVAVREDILSAIAHFDIDPAAFYDNAHDQDVARAEAEVYRLTGEFYRG